MTPNDTAPSTEERGAKALRALRLLMSAASLGDYVYDVREREGLGWDGPKVKAWSDGCVLADEAVRGLPPLSTPDADGAA